ncbi:hypothetical protein [Aureivirga sp. CE67]|uniref:hypothetical protein n=1 Tax=Aureivirga sp. CE67 TaxID=1788983 RepID=UPI0018CB2DE7|nr:hypothetical protein [Aureivirga sp. CE67]
MIKKDYFRNEKELTLAVEIWGWKFHHLGIPTTEQKENETYIPHLKMYITGFPTSPFGVEWMRFEKDSPIHPLIQKIPHLAFLVENIEDELKKRNFKILSPESSPSGGIKVVMIEHNGAPIELLEFISED